MKKPKQDNRVYDFAGYTLDCRGDGATKVVRPVMPVTSAGEDYGCDPLGDGNFRMVPSGDIVDNAECARRLARYQVFY